MAEDTPLNTVPAEDSSKRSTNLSDIERQNIVEILLRNSEDGKPNRGIISSTAAQFRVFRQSISKLWRIATIQVKIGDPVNVKAKKKGNCGRKHIHVDLTGLSDIPLSRRTNFRSLAVVLHCSKSTVHKLLMQGLIKAHTSAVKPFLTPVNMQRRLDYCISQITCFSPNMFDANYQTIHIDEKWFYITKQSNRYYMDPAEVDPYRTCKNKRFITKVMFMGAVGRLRYDENGAVTFDEKIGIFPFVVEEPTKRKSKNRPVRVSETKAELSITKSVIKACLLEKLLPAIKSKWPTNASRRIVIQQDNARPHLDPNDSDWLTAATEDGWDISLKCQPPNSPDLNVLDLGFFRAIQSLQHQNSPNTVLDLVDDVIRAYNDLEVKSLNFVWLSLQQCMLEIMKIKGSNSYKLPHMNKNGLFIQGVLPVSLEVPNSLLSEITKGSGIGSGSTEIGGEIQFMDEDIDDLQP